MDHLKGFLRPLPEGFSHGSYYGFTIKKDFLYGQDEQGIPIAYTKFAKDGKYFIYKFVDEQWKQVGISFDELLSLLCKKQTS